MTIQQLPNINDVTSRSIVRGRSFHLHGGPPSNLSESTGGNATISDAEGWRIYNSKSTAGDQARLHIFNHGRRIQDTEMKFYMSFVMFDVSTIDTGANAGLVGLINYNDTTERVGIDLTTQEFVVDGNSADSGLDTSDNARPALVEFVMDPVAGETRFESRYRAGSKSVTINATSRVDGPDIDLIHFESGGDSMAMRFGPMAYAYLK